MNYTFTNNDSALPGSPNGTPYSRLIAVGPDAPKWLKVAWGRYIARLSFLGIQFYKSTGKPQLYLRDFPLAVDDLGPECRAACDADTARLKEKEESQ